MARICYNSSVRCYGRVLGTGSDSELETATRREVLARPILQGGRQVTNLLLDLTPSEVEIIRQALRAQEEAHKRNDFKALVLQVQELRSKISDAILESHKDLTRV